MSVDPTRSTSPGLGRGPFLGLTAGAAAAGARIARALADEQTFGKPHSPIVAEDDPAIVVERPQLSRASRSIDAYAAYPKVNDDKTPGIVIAQHVWGVDAQIRDTVRRLAKAGFVTVAPDLSAGLGAPSGDGATDYAPFGAIAAQLDPDRVDSDMASAATWVRARAGASALQRPPKVGAIGFCMGGKIALRAAVDDTRVFDACVMFYGAVRWDDSKNQGPISAAALAWTNMLAIPLMGQFGQRDTSILPADVQAAQARLTVPNDIKIYPEAGHAFFDDTRNRYVATAAADAWTRTLAWFNKYLAS
jgi:carboxymethylenebutenolidase